MKLPDNYDEQYNDIYAYFKGNTPVYDAHPKGNLQHKKDKAGVKHDKGKLPYHLLPVELLEGVGAVLEFGANKYAPRNWELGMDWSRLFSALMRHMWAWWRGKDKDEETGMSHLWHAGCCIAFLIAYEQRNVGKDDRPK